MDLAKRRWELVLERIQRFRTDNSYKGPIVIGGSAALCCWKLVDRYPHDIDIQIPGVSKGTLSRAFKNVAGLDVFLDKPYLTKSDLELVADMTWVVKETPMIMTKLTSSLDYPAPNKHSQDIEKILARVQKREQVRKYFQKRLQFFDKATQNRIRHLFYRAEQGEKNVRK